MKYPLIPLLLSTTFIQSSLADASLSDQEILQLDAESVMSLTIRKDEGGGEVNHSSGFIVSPEGHILTVAHVRPGQGEHMEGTIGQLDGTSYKLNLIGIDAERDVALWQLGQAQHCRPSLPLSVDRAVVSEELLAVGFPKGLGLTLISAKASNLFGPDGLLIVDGFLGPGSSGSPVSRRDGRVIGIVRGSNPTSASNNHVIPIAFASGLLQTIARWPPPQVVEVYPIQCYKNCRAAENGIESWQHSAGWHQDSGWLGGGNNRSAVCYSLKAAWESGNPGQFVEITRMGEENNKDILGHVEYKYHCDGTAQSGPIYAKTPSRACGLIGAP